MTNKVYRSAQGKTIDIGALQLQNEGVRAVGNMGVNARGDRIDNQNKNIDSRNNQLKRQYQKQISNVSDGEIPVSIKKSSVKKSAPTIEKPETEPVQEPLVKSPAPSDIAEGGLAAAIARARAIKQEPLKTPKQLAQQKAGVTKI